MAIPKPYIKNANRCFGPVYVPGENYAFYINFDVPISDPGFANFRLRIYKGADMILDDIGLLKKDVVKSVLYNIYCEFVMPALEDGTYQFVIYDIVAGVEKCRSNIFFCSNSSYAKNTIPVSYRNSENVYGFQYETLVNYTNRFRLPLVRTELQFEGERKQYRNASDRRLRNVKSYRDQLFEVESYYFDDKGHEAATAMYEHDSVAIDNDLYVVKTAYQIDTIPENSLTKGKIQLYLQETLGPINFLPGISGGGGGTGGGGNCPATIVSFNPPSGVPNNGDEWIVIY